MILAFQLSDLITIPFGYLLGWLYQLTSNYGLALILFALLVKLVLMPASAKGKKSTMKMSRLTPQMNLIREKYANDQQKMNMAIQELYKEFLQKPGSHTAHKVLHTSYKPREKFAYKK